MSKIKNSGLDQYGAEPFEQQQFGTGGVEWVKPNRLGFFVVVRWAAIKVSIVYLERMH